MAEDLVQEIRRAALQSVAMPPRLVQRALDKLESKLDAKETKFFASKGKVTDIKSVDAHSVQLEAVDKILSVAGLYAREREAPTAVPETFIETSPNGVVRIRVGMRPAIGSGIDAPRALPTEPTPFIREQALVVASAAEEPVGARRSDTPSPLTRPRRVPVPPSVWNIISDEIVE